MQFELAPFALPTNYAEGIVSLADMKDHLSFTAEETEFDDLIGLYRDAAVDMVERYCGIRLGEVSGATLRTEALCSNVRLGVWPVTAITAITWLDSEGEAVTGTASDWRVVMRDHIALKPGRTLPSGIGGGVVIIFDAGFAAEERPAALVQAVKLFAAHLFLHREAVITGTISSEIPLGFKMLCSQYRMPVI
jgi:uncharacterized phiE125 gp8 family phage protein